MWFTPVSNSVSLPKSFFPLWGTTPSSWKECSDLVTSLARCACLCRQLQSIKKLEFCCRRSQRSFLSQRCRMLRFPQALRTATSGFSFRQTSTSFCSLSHSAPYRSPMSKKKDLASSFLSFTIPSSLQKN